MRHFKSFALQGTATLALIGALSATAQAQVNIDADTTDQIRTSTAGPGGEPSDVTIDSGITVTGNTANPAVILDSDNALVNDGAVLINIENPADQAAGQTPVGVSLEGGANRSYTQTGSVTISEDFTPEDTDDDPFTDGGVALGANRTGILISGASPFQGNIEFTETSSVTVEGNDSFGVNLANTPMMMEGLTGNLTTAGNILVTGDRSTGVNIGSNVTGDLTNNGGISATGEGARGYVVDGDVQGGFVNSGTINANGFRFGTRPNFGGPDTALGREDLTEEDLRQAGSALIIAGDVSDGIFLQQRTEQVFDADGNPVLDANENIVFSTASISSISQFGSAPAVIIGRDGNPIAVGVIADITDPMDADFDESLQFAFINQGSVSANGVFDDFDATAVSISNATLEGGISNTGSLNASTFRAPIETDIAQGDGIARVLVLGDNAIVDRINNSQSGIILAQASEAADQIFFDRTNIIAPRELLAVAIDIGENAAVSELANAGSISAILVGREGTAVAVRDTSGTLRSLDNTGNITTFGSNSDTAGLEETNFNLIAIDVSALTEGFTFTQSQSEDTTAVPFVIGDILLGSGDDTVAATAGAISGDIDFGGGNDSLSLSGGAVFEGGITNTDALALSVTDNASLTLQSATPIPVSDARFDGTSSFRPIVDGQTGLASTLVAENSITFEAGATINPLLSSIINDVRREDVGFGDGVQSQSFNIAVSDNLTVGDLAGLSAGVSPFLYDTSLSLADDNTLVITLDLRDPLQSVENGGLGLDTVQAAAFGEFVDGQFNPGAAFQAFANTPELGNAFANITESSEFNAAINQILPEFSGAAKQFVLANVDGAVGAVGSHLDTARRSPDRTGGAWIQEFFYFADRSLAGQSEQYRGSGFGFTGGLDTAFGPFHAVGISTGFASTEIEDVVGIDNPLNVRTYSLGAYAGFESNGLSIDTYGGLGFNQFDQDRVVQVSNFLGTAQGEWDGLHANASIRAGYDIALSEKYWIRPRASLDYLYLNEYGRTETGTQGIALRVDGRRSETAAATASIDFGAKFQGNRTWIQPSFRVGYRNEFISDPVETAFRFQGLQGADGALFDSELARLRSLAFPNEGIILGFTVAAGSEFSSIGFDFDSDIRDGFIRHTGRIVIRLLF